MPELLEQTDASTKDLRTPALIPRPPGMATFRLVLLVLTIAFGLAAIVLTVRHVTNQRRALEEAKNTGRRSAIEKAAIIDAQLEKIPPAAERIAAELSSGTLKPEEAFPELKRVLEENPDLLEAGFAYLPFANNPGARLFAPDALRNGDDITEIRLEQQYDYTTYPWFKEGIEARGPHWGEPYLGQASKMLVAGYTVPFYRKGDPGKTPIGVVRFNLSLAQIHHVVSSIGLGETGYASLLSRKGVFLSHPVEDFVRQQRTIFDIGREFHDEGAKHQGERAAAGQSGEDEGVSFVTGRAIWVFNQPVPTTGWSLGVVLMKDEMLLEPRVLRRSLTGIECCSVMFLLFLSMLCFWVDEVTDQSLWRIVVATSVIGVGGISLMWWLTLHYPDRNGEVGVHIYENASLQRFLASNSATGNAGLLQQVKAGIFVRTMRFGAANDVQVTGTMWQSYDSSLKDFTPGFTIPNAEALELKETYHAKKANLDLIGWDFKATLRVPFEGSFKYPFDRGMVRVRIAPKGFYKDIVLVPDLGSYQLIVPTALPGIDKALVLPGWKLISSYFIYSPVSVGTDFGMGTALEQSKSQELGFTMIAERNFLDPFISSVLPIIVVAALLFGLLVAGSKQTAKIAATGFKATDVLRASVSLLFPVLIAQVNMRSKIGSNTIIYIEYFYFVLYTAILGVSANALLFTLKGQGFSNYRDNIIPKLIFWPYILGSFFCITLIFLY